MMDLLKGGLRVAGGVPSQQYLKEILYYNKQFGIFVWKSDGQGKRKAGNIAGYKKSTGYTSIKVNGIAYSAHRLVFLYVFGAFPPECTDHINGIRSDNRLTNLRAVSNKENHRNLNRLSKSGILGVCFKEARSNWVVKISTKYIGSYSDFFEACCARKSAELEEKYHENHGRNQQGRNACNLNAKKYWHG